MNCPQFFFYLIGIGFGVGSSMTKVDVVSWIKAPAKYRLYRTIIGGASYYLIQYGYSLAKEVNEHSTGFTNYIVWHAMPQLIQGLIVYGLIPTICIKMGLIQKKEFRAVKEK